MNGVLNNITDWLRWVKDEGLVDVSATSVTISSPSTDANTAKILQLNASDKVSESTLTGTANQIVVTPSSGAVTLSLPQNIHTAATPTFAGVNAAVVSTPRVDRGTAGALLIGDTNATSVVVGNAGAIVELAGTNINIGTNSGDSINIGKAGSQIHFVGDVFMPPSTGYTYLYADNGIAYTGTPSNVSDFLSTGHVRIKNTAVNADTKAFIGVESLGTSGGAGWVFSRVGATASTTADLYVNATGAAGALDTKVLSATSTGVTVTGNIAVTGTVDGVDVAGSINQGVKTTDSPTFADVTVAGNSLVHAQYKQAWSQDYASLNAAISAITTQNYTLYVTAPFAVTGTLTIPSNVRLEFLRNGEITASSPVDIYVACEIVADGHKIFDDNITFSGPGFRNTLNIKWFGALGDNNTDDAAAFSRAFSTINALNTIEAPAIYIPKGMYSIGSTPTALVKPCTIYGDSRWSTILKPDTGVYAISVGNGTTETGVSLRDLWFYGHGTKVGVGVLILQEQGDMPVDIRCCTFENLEYGCLIGGDSTTPTKHVGTMISDCVFRRNTEGLSVATRAEYCLVSNCHMYENNYGVRDYAGNLAICNCNISDNAIGFCLEAGDNDSHGSVTGCMINHNSSYSVKVGEIGVKAHQFTGCNIFAGDLYFYKCGGVSFSNCRIEAVNNIYFEGSKGVRFSSCIIEEATTINNNFNSDPSFTRWENCVDKNGILVAGDYQYNGGLATALVSSSQTIADGATAAVDLGTFGSYTARNTSQTLYSFANSSTEVISRGLGNGQIAISGTLRVVGNPAVADWEKVYCVLKMNGGILKYMPCQVVKVGGTKYPFFDVSYTGRSKVGDIYKIEMSNGTGQTLTLDGTGGGGIVFEGL
jgi:hypothetical protein